MAIGSAREAYDAGIATVYQELALVDTISIWRNMLLGREAQLRRGMWPARWLDRAKGRAETRETLAELGIQLRSPDELVEKLSGGQRQSIAIARAMHFSAKLIILDEPGLHCRFVKRKKCWRLSTARETVGSRW
jgi:simple sugar transport system ATP-binding protein